MGQTIATPDQLKGASIKHCRDLGDGECFCAADTPEVYICRTPPHVYQLLEQGDGTCGPSADHIITDTAKVRVLDRTKFGF
jgi:hypothetical protein